SAIGDGAMDYVHHRRRRYRRVGGVGRSASSRPLTLFWNFSLKVPDCMSVDDERLLERARRGDENAFSELFSRYQRQVFRYAAYMCGAERADDVVQDTFLAVLRQTNRRDRLRGTLIGYLIGIARHVAMKRQPAAFERALVSADDAVDTA